MTQSLLVPVRAIVQEDSHRRAESQPRTRKAAVLLVLAGYGPLAVALMFHERDVDSACSEREPETGGVSAAEQDHGCCVLSVPGDASVDALSLRYGAAALALHGDEDPRGFAVVAIFLNVGPGDGDGRLPGLQAEFYGLAEVKLRTDDTSVLPVPSGGLLPGRMALMFRQLDSKRIADLGRGVQHETV